MTTPTTNAPSKFSVVQEPDEIASRTVARVLVVGVVVTVAAVAISAALLGTLRPSLPKIAANSIPMAPRQIARIHQTPIERDRHGLELREQQRHGLERYGWVDRNAGIAQIPITRAMQLVMDDPTRTEGLR